MAEKKKVYVETSVIGYLVARPSHDVIKTARQIATRDWWDAFSSNFELFASALVEREASKGDMGAAAKRLAVLRDIKKIAVTQEMLSLADKLLEATAVPRTSYEDAVHVAVASVSGMDFLLSWNCRHIVNPATRPTIRKVLTEQGYAYPEICTPMEMQGGEL